MARRPQRRARRSPAARPASDGRGAGRNSIGIDDEGKLDEGTLRRFVFRTFGRARRTQDSPVMPDVWLRFIRAAERTADAPPRDRKQEPIDLLLTPWSGVRPAEIAKRLRDRLDPPAETRSPKKKPGERLSRARIAISDSRVVACVDFKTLVCDVVPLTGWWHNLFHKRKETEEEKKQTAVERFERVFGQIEHSVEAGKRPTGSERIELYRYAALVGFIDSLMAARSRRDVERLASLAARLGPPPDEEADESRELSDEEAELVRRARRLMRPPQEPAGKLAGREAGSDNGTPGHDAKGVFLISLNRRAAQTLFESRATVKADAANRVFNINTSGITFAVIDGGIDATHPAFLNRSNDDVKKRLDSGDEPERDFLLKNSRVAATYDFTILRDIVAYAGNPEGVQGPNTEAVKRIFAIKKHKKAIEHLEIRNNNARDLDWDMVRPLIQVPHDRAPQSAEDEDDDAPQGKSKGRSRDASRDYRLPGTDHGTHVAGILAADMPNDRDTGRDLIGMCPQLSLYDLRVFDASGHGDEFAILCATEFVGWLNRDRANPVVHGVNLSLALAHDVDSFACGQTPICEACNHLVGAGTVVVTAAGNTGFEGGVEKQSLGTGYRAISITDPGNADNVITVGSTHRRDPHLYGVSYFSARGPTGDGRRKPDILAPGEKITSTVPNGGSQRMDGTSMASPHVAGAAALLMARYPELIGRPLRIKEILMQTATDLKRESSFQGAGLVDVLRALQSV
jgi:subtilisin family serine protease